MAHMLYNEKRRLHDQKIEEGRARINAEASAAQEKERATQAQNKVNYQDDLNAAREEYNTFNGKALTGRQFANYNKNDPNNYLGSGMNKEGYNAELARLNGNRNAIIKSGNTQTAYKGSGYDYTRPTSLSGFEENVTPTQTQAATQTQVITPTYSANGDTVTTSQNNQVSPTLTNRNLGLLSEPNTTMWDQQELTASQPTGDDSSITRQQIEQLFTSRGLPINQDGVDYLMGDAANGQSLEDITKTLVQNLTQQQKETVIDNIYQRIFGRPVEQSGLDFWMDFYNNNPGANLEETIKGAARDTGYGAMVDIANGGLNFDNTWDSSLDVNSPNIYYDTTLHKWVDPSKTDSEPDDTGDDTGDDYVPQPRHESTVDSNNFGNEFVNPLSMASTQAANILKEGNPLLEAAQTYADQLSNDKGIVNTSMGTTAGTQAVTNVAAELGMNQAGVYQTAQSALQNHNYSSDLSAQNAQQNSDLSKQNAHQTSDLSSQQSQQAQELAKLTSSLSAENQKIQNEFANKLTQLGYKQQDIQSLNNIMANQSTALINNIGSLLRDPNIELGDNAIKMMSDFMYASWESAANLLGLNIQVA